MAKKKPAKKPAVKKPIAKPIAKLSMKPAAKQTAKQAAKKPAVKTSVVKAAKKTIKMSPSVKAQGKSVAPLKSTVVSKTTFQAAPKSKMKASKNVEMTKFNPLDDRIVIERVIAPEKTAGGLFIPDSAQEKPTLGKVVAVGRGHRDAKGRTRPCDVKVGDQVLFTAWSGSEIEVEGMKYVIMRETDLLGVTTV